MVLVSDGGDAGDLYLEYIARRHDRHHLNIDPELYSLWIEALITSVRECDTEFDLSVEKAWRSVLGLRYRIHDLPLLRPSFPLVDCRYLLRCDPYQFKSGRLSWVGFCR